MVTQNVLLCFHGAFGTVCFVQVYYLIRTPHIKESCFTISLRSNEYIADLILKMRFLVFALVSVKISKFDTDPSVLEVKMLNNIFYFI